MKLGAENRNKTIAATVLGILAILFFVRMLSTFTGDTQAAGPALGNAAGVNAATAAASQPNPPSSGRASTTRQRVRNSNSKDKRVAGATLTHSLDPRLNLALLEQSEKITYSGTGRNIFKMEPEPPPIEKPLASAETPKPDRFVPQGAAPPPSIPLKFYGWASKPGETRSVFLSSGGGDVFVAREGDIVNRRYKIVRIQPNTVEVEDMLTNARQNLPLSQG
jgi:hypothetical protein